MHQPYVNKLGLKHQITRFVWNATWAVCARWIPRSLGSSWKRCLLRMFGAKIAGTAVVYSSAKIYYPKNLIMLEYSCLGSDVDCYNVAPITIGNYSTISQGTFLCTASHDVDSPNHELITSPIIIGKNVWVGAHAYIAMGVTIDDYAVVGATASVYKSVGRSEIVGGNPAKLLRLRKLNSSNEDHA